MQTCVSFRKLIALFLVETFMVTTLGVDLAFALRPQSAISRGIADEFQEAANREDLKTIVSAREEVRLVQVPAGLNLNRMKRWRAKGGMVFPDGRAFLEKNTEEDLGHFFEELARKMADLHQTAARSKEYEPLDLVGVAYAIQELLKNAVIHGNAFRKGESVILTWDIQPDRLVLNVFDRALGETLSAKEKEEVLNLLPRGLNGLKIGLYTLQDSFGRVEKEDLLREGRLVARAYRVVKGLGSSKLPQNQSSQDGGRRSSSPEDKILKKYLKEVGQSPRLTREEERGLGSRIRQGDEEALRQLVEGNLRFVVSYAKKYRGDWLPYLDLINAGNRGLIQAAAHFDPNLGIKFITYAVWWIRESIIQALNKEGHTIYLPRKQAELLLRIQRQMTALETQGEEVSVEQVIETELLAGKGKWTIPSAKKLAKKVAKVQQMMRVGTNPLSLDDYIDEDHQFRIREKVRDETIPSPEEVVSKQETKEILAKELAKLGRQQQKVLRRRFGLDGQDPKTLKAVGEEMHLSRERIRQIQREALQKLEKSPNAHALSHNHNSDPSGRAHDGGVQNLEEAANYLLPEGVRFYRVQSVDEMRTIPYSSSGVVEIYNGKQWALRYGDDWLREPLSHKMGEMAERYAKETLHLPSTGDDNPTHLLKGAFEKAAYEGFLNAMVHGNRSEPDRPIFIAWRFQPHEMSLHLFDEAIGAEGRVSLKPTDPSELKLLVRAHGFAGKGKGIQEIRQNGFQVHARRVWDKKHQIIGTEVVFVIDPRKVVTEGRGSNDGGNQETVLLKSIPAAAIRSPIQAPNPLLYSSP